VVAAVEEITSTGAPIYFTPQVVRESWSVLTRPRDVGGYGLTPALANTFIERAHWGFRFASDTPEIYDLWRDLVKTHQVSGRQAHDAYHVAAMIAHGLSRVLTLDVRDFNRYPGIAVLDPATM